MLIHSISVCVYVVVSFSMHNQFKHKSSVRRVCKLCLIQVLSRFKTIKKTTTAEAAAEKKLFTSNSPCRWPIYWSLSFLLFHIRLWPLSQCLYVNISESYCTASTLYIHIFIPFRCIRLRSLHDFYFIFFCPP